MRHVFSDLPHRAASISIAACFESLWQDRGVLDYLGRVLREFLYVGISSRIGLFLKFRQILFVIFHHHIHVSFI